jgi:hypothetical protein
MVRSVILAIVVLVIVSSYAGFASDEKAIDYNQQAEQKLDKIIIPQVVFKEAKANDIIQFINYCAFEHDNTGIGRKGMQIIGRMRMLHAKPPTNLPLTENISIRQLLDLMCKEWDAEYFIEDGAIIIKEKEKPFVLDKSLPLEEQLRILLRRENAQIDSLGKFTDEDKDTLLDVGLKNATADQLGVLKGYPVYRLVLETPKIRTVPPVVSGLPVRVLAFIGCEQLEDVGDLAGSSLQQLIIEDGKFKSIEVLKSLNNIERLTLRHVPVNDISSLKGLSLKTLFLAYTDVVDFSPLQGMKLRQLDLSGNNLKNIDFVKSMPLKDFSISNTKVNNIRALKDMPIEYLSIYGSKIDDLSALETMPLIELRTDLSVGNNVDVVIPKIKTLKRVRLHYLDGFYSGEATPQEYVEKWKDYRAKKAPAP